MLATNRFSISAAETFALTMALSKDVTIVGDTTSGAFSDVVPRELPNGWIYRVSIGGWRDAAGKSYEGKGFPPTIVIKNDSTDVANGKDDVLIKAMAILK